MLYLVPFQLHQLCTFKDWPAAIALDPRPDKEHLITYITSAEPTWKHGAEGYITVYDMEKHQYSIESPELVSSEAFRYSTNGDYLVVHKKYPTSFFMMSSDDFTVLQLLDYAKYCPFVDLPFYLPPKVDAILRVDLLRRISAAKVIVRSEGLQGLALREESCFLIIPIVPLRGEKLAVVHLSISDPMNASEVEVHNFRPDEEEPVEDLQAPGMEPARRQSLIDEILEDAPTTAEQQDSRALKRLALKWQKATFRKKSAAEEAIPSIVENGLGESDMSLDPREDEVFGGDIPTAQTTEQAAPDLKPGEPTSPMSNTKIIEMLQDKVGQDHPSEALLQGREEQGEVRPAAPTTDSPSEGPVFNVQDATMFRQKQSGNDDKEEEVVEHPAEEEPPVEDGSQIVVAKETMEVSLPSMDDLPDAAVALQDDVAPPDEPKRGKVVKKVAALWQRTASHKQPKTKEAVDGGVIDATVNTLDTEESSKDQPGQESESRLQETDHETGSQEAKLESPAEEKIVTKDTSEVDTNNEEPGPSTDEALEDAGMDPGGRVKDLAAETQKTEKDREELPSQKEEGLEEDTSAESEAEDEVRAKAFAAELQTAEQNTNDQRQCDETTAVPEPERVEDAVLTKDATREQESTEDEVLEKALAAERSDETSISVQDIPSTVQEYVEPEDEVVAKACAAERAHAEGSATRSEERFNSQSNIPDRGTQEQSLLKTEVMVTATDDGQHFDETDVTYDNTDMLRVFGDGHKEPSKIPTPLEYTPKEEQDVDTESEQETFEEWTVEETVVVHHGGICEQDAVVEECSPQVEPEGRKECEEDKWERDRNPTEEWTAEQSASVQEKVTVHHTVSTEQDISDNEETLDESQEKAGGQDEKPVESDQQETFEEWTVEEAAVRHPDEEDTQQSAVSQDIESEEPDKASNSEQEEIFEEWTVEEAAVRHPDEDTQQSAVSQDIESEEPDKASNSEQEEIFEEWTVEEAAVRYPDEDTQQSAVSQDIESEEPDKASNSEQEEIFEEWTVEEAAVRYPDEDTQQSAVSQDIESEEPDKASNSEQEEIFEEWTVEEAAVRHPDEEDTQQSVVSQDIESEGPDEASKSEQEERFKEWTVEETVVQHQEKDTQKFEMGGEPKGEAPESVMHRIDSVIVQTYSVEVMKNGTSHLVDQGKTTLEKHEVITKSNSDRAVPAASAVTSSGDAADGNFGINDHHTSGEIDEPLHKRTVEDDDATDTKSPIGELQTDSRSRSGSAASSASSEMVLLEEWTEETIVQVPIDEEHMQQGMYSNTDENWNIVK